MNLNWKSHLETPGENGVIGLLARPANPDDAEDVPFILGLYLFQGGTWLSEEFEEEPDAPYFWVLESELLAGLPAAGFCGADFSPPRSDWWAEAHPTADPTTSARVCGIAVSSTRRES